MLTVFTANRGLIRTLPGLNQYLDEIPIIGELDRQEVTAYSEIIRPQASVIRFNETYIEVCDSWDATRYFHILCFIILIIVVAGLSYFLIKSFIPVVFTTGDLFPILVDIIGGIAFFIVFFIMLHAIKKLIYRKTYPMRFNRVTQKFYAFRKDGSVFSCDWTDLRVFFIKFQGYYELRMCIVDEDEIVREIFPMPARLDTGIGTASDRDVRIAMLSHWEFFRRYMSDEDLAELSPFVTETYADHFYQPTLKSVLRRLLINYRQENKDYTEDDRYVGFLMLTIIFYWIPMLPIIYLINRLQAMPKFPDCVEAECKISDKDIYDSMKYPRKQKITAFTCSEILENFWMYLFGLILGVGAFYLMYVVMGYYFILEIAKGV